MTEVWSYGGGVQSCAIAALLVQDRIPKPDVAVIADTGMEQSTTWSYLADVVQPAMTKIGIIVHIVKAADFATVGTFGGAEGKSLLIPAFTNKSGNIGKLPGYCSNEWKARVIDRWLSKRGVKKGVKWLGFSTDELERMKPNTKKWAHRYPLIDQIMNRGDCQAIVERLGWPPSPRSSCWMCPNHTQVEWRDIRDNKPKDWANAVAFDKWIRKTDENAYVHSDCVPLEEADLDEKNETFFTRCESGHCFT